MPDDIEKSEQPNHEEVAAAILSFNDPSIITNIFRELGWSYSLEIKETLTMAKQNANLSIKFKAIKHLRELLREAAETAGYTASVSQTIPNAHGGHTTFHAKRIANILNPTKQIESTIKESQNDKIEETRTESNRGSDRGQSEGTDTRTQFPSEPERDTGRADSIGDVDSGGTEPPDRGETPGRPDIGREINSGRAANLESEKIDNPCIKTRPPTCDQDLFPGISSAEGS